MTLAAAAAVLDASLTGEDAVFDSVSTDTRTIERGGLFVALRGPNFDGHRFIAAARAAGAVGALVETYVDDALAQIKTADSKTALGRLAAHWRAQFSCPVIAVTGSNGKTTVKNMLAAIMAERGRGIATAGNLNNEIGVPLTLLRMRDGDDYAVIEMGMNHAGEISYLTGLARPSVALITNAAAAHLEGLGSIEAVAHAKGEIFEGLDQDGIAVINADDEYAPLWRSLAGTRRTVSFGFGPEADVRAQYEVIDFGSNVLLKTVEGEITMRLSLLGKHNVLNAAAAAGAAIAAGASLGEVKRGLENLRAAAGRLEVKDGINGACVLDDTYNANPASVAAGLQVLREVRGEKVLVLGDMAELGDSAIVIHKRVGDLAKALGVNRLFCLGELSRHAAEAFGPGARHFDDFEALAADVAKVMHKGMIVLVKGSRSMKMERVVAAISADQ